MALDPESRKNMEIFIALVERGEDALDIPMAWASLTAAIKGPIEIKNVLADLIRLKEEVREEYSKLPLSLEGRLRQLNICFSERLGFKGNIDAYGDPSNTYMDEVLKKRVGIPISLCMIFIEIGRALDLDIDPIGFPAHFLVRERESGIVCDPFFSRIGLAKEDCLSIVSRIFGRSVSWNDRFMNVTTKTNILIRMLNNLRNNFFANNDNHRLLVTDKILERLSLMDVPMMSAPLN